MFLFCATVSLNALIVVFSMLPGKQKRDVAASRTGCRKRSPSAAFFDIIEMSDRSANEGKRAAASNRSATGSTSKDSSSEKRLCWPSVRSRIRLFSMFCD